MFARYAVYFVPDGSWGDFGAAWLGWDVRKGVELALPSREHAALTERPRRYGFHATVQAPFRLAEGCTEDQIGDAAEAACAEMRPIALASLRLSRIGRFFALTAPEEGAALQQLADRTVEAVDALRAPPTPGELARKRAGTLTDRQEELLLRWGYPYVREQYRFHLTLTGPVREPDAIAPDLKARLAEPLSWPLSVDSLSLLGEGADGRFRQLARFPL